MLGRGIRNTVLLCFALADASTLSQIDGYCTADGWMLYLYNGAEQQFKNVLKLGRNSDGLGSLNPLPSSGGHKMAEWAFDQHQFVELKAVGSDGAQVELRRLSGAPFTASEAFLAGCARDLWVRTGYGAVSTWACASNYGCDTKHFQTEGPFYHDLFGQSFGWMWTDWHGEGDDRKGTVYGQGAPVTGYAWAWYGRDASGQCTLLRPPTTTSSTITSSTTTSSTTTSTTTRTTTTSSSTTTSTTVGFALECFETRMSCRLPPAARDYKIVGSELQDACRPQVAEDGGVLYDIAFEGECNVLRRYNGSNFIYSVVLAPPRGSLILLGATETNMNYTCRCVAPVLGSGSTDVQATVEPTQEDRTDSSPFEPGLRVYANASFDVALSPGEDLPVDAESIYLQANSINMEDTLGWVSCTASPSTSVDDQFAAPLLQQSCPVGPVNPQELPVMNQTNVVRLSMPLFKFAGTSTIYFVCMVVRCPGSSCGQCESRRLRRRLESVSTSEPRTAAVGAWLRSSGSVDVLLPGPVSAELARVLWEDPNLPASFVNTLASNITFYGCDADPTQPAFREAVTIAIAKQLEVEEARVQITRVAVVSADDLRRRLQRMGSESVGAIVIDYVVPGGAARVLDKGDAGAFVQHVHNELSARGLGSALGSSAFFAAAPLPSRSPVAVGLPVAPEGPADGAEQVREEGAVPLGLLLGGIAGGAIMVGSLALVLCVRHRKRQRNSS